MLSVLLLPVSGGAGATAVGVGLATLLSKGAPAGKGAPALPSRSVLYAEMGEPAADLYFGAAETTVTDLSDLLGGASAEDAAVVTPCGARLLRGRYPAAPLTAETAETLLRAGDALSSDVLLCDASGFCAVSPDAIPAFDRVLLVSPPTSVGARATEAHGMQIASIGAKPMQIINGFDPDGGVFLSSRVEETRVPLCGVVPLSAALARAMETGDGAGSENDEAAFRNIALRLTGGEIPLFTGFGGIRRSKWIR